MSALVLDRLDRLPLRLPLVIAGSFLVHALVLSQLGALRTEERAKTLALTEVEYQEEAVPKSELEKLMFAPAAKPAAVNEEVRSESLAALEKQSFSQAVGLAPRKALDEVTESDLAQLAALPKLQAIAPAPDMTAPKPSLALVRQPDDPSAALQSKVVPLENDLPPADFGPGLTGKTFQQPELVIKQVKAERRERTAGLGVRRALTLDRNATISGEVRNREILSRDYPEPPRWLEEKGIEAEVVIGFVVNPDGEVGDTIFVEKTSGYAELDRLAIDALRRFQFAPLPLTDKQVEQRGSIVFRFSFNKR